MRDTQETIANASFKNVLITLVGAMALGFLFFLHTRGYPTQDESWFLQAAARMTSGEVPYSDFQFIYHPAGIYLTWIGYQVFGVSVFASRMMALLNTLIAIAAIWWLARILNWSKIITWVVSVSFVLWGAGHINFIWPVMLCLTTGLLASAVFTKQTVVNDLGARYLFLGGVLVGVTLLFKQNFGVAIGVATFIFFIIQGGFKDIKKLLLISLGFGSVILIQLIIFVVTGSFGAYFEDMRYLLIEKVVGEGVLNSDLPWQYPAPIYIQFAKFILYLLPLLIGLGTYIVLWRKKLFHKLYLPLLTICYYALSIRPTTDIIHLAPLIALSSICLGQLYQECNQAVVRRTVVLFLMAISVLGFYHGIIKNYYRWDMPLIDQNYFWNVESAQLWVNPGVAERDEEIIKYFQSHQLSGDQLFVYSYAPYYYLLLDKKNPTRYDYLHSGVLSEPIETEIISILESKSLAYILTNASLIGDTSLIAKFIQSNYIQAKTWDDIVVWQRIDLAEKFESK